MEGGIESVGVREVPVGQNHIRQICDNASFRISKQRLNTIVPRLRVPGSKQANSFGQVDPKRLCFVPILKRQNMLRLRLEETVCGRASLSLEFLQELIFDDAAPIWQLQFDAACF